MIPSSGRAQIAKSTVDDAWALAPRLRAEDIAECKAMSGSDPREVLEASFEACQGNCFTVWLDSMPVAMFGCAQMPNQPNMGIIWLLGSDDLKKMSLQFLRDSRKWIDHFHETWPVLYNLVDARNELHIRWLKYMGFQFLKLHPKMGEGQLPFHEVIHVKQGAFTTQARPDKVA